MPMNMQQFETKQRRQQNSGKNSHNLYIIIISELGKKACKNCMWL